MEYEEDEDKDQDDEDEDEEDCGMREMRRMRGDVNRACWLAGLAGWLADWLAKTFKGDRARSEPKVMDF